MAKQYVVGLDLGGTNLKAGLLDEQAHLLSKFSVPAGVEQGPDVTINRMAEAVERAIREAGVSRDEVLGVGIGSPGPMSHRDGTIINPTNLPGWGTVPMRDRIREKTGMATVMDNDANAAAWGEFWAGAGKDVQDMVMFTLGTGVGGGVVIEGRLLRGFFENGAELGHMLVCPGGEPCNCGQRGCLEAYSSAAHTARRATEAVQAGQESSLRATLEEKGKIECEDVEAAARAHDPLASRIWDESCYYLAVACVNVQHFCNPQRIVLAGGMIGAGDFLLQPIRDHFEKLTWRLVNDQPEIRLATLGNDAGLIGAAGLVFQAQREGELALSDR